MFRSIPFPRHSLPALLLILGLLPGCASDPLTATPPSAPSDSAIAPPIPQPSASIAAPPDATPTAVSIVTNTITLAPIQPLGSDEIIDRLLADVRALTDGETPYKTIAWGPGSDWIAAVPQDGPGMDIINSATGEILSVVTDTYVLEPVWADDQSLVVHVTNGQGDALLRYDVYDQTFAPQPIASDPQPLMAVSAGDGVASFATQDTLHIAPVTQASDPPMVAPIAALISAPADADTVAITPFVSNLEDVQTVLLRRDDDQIISTPLSERGEGLWLPRWSHDRAKLVLTSIGGRIVSATADGSHRYDLGPGDAPAWSPDGSRIAYAGTNAGDDFVTRNIHIVDWQGRQLRQRVTIATDDEFYVSPTWSPDGSRIAFVGLDSGQIFVGEVR